MLEHNREVQLESTEPHQCCKSGSLVLTNVNVAGKSNCLDDMDIPERMQVLLSNLLSISNLSVVIIMSSLFLISL